MQGFEKIYVGRLFSEYLKWGVLGVWMTFKKAEMAKTLKNGLSMIKMNPLNHNWSHFVILLGLTLHQFQKNLLLSRCHFKIESISKLYQIGICSKTKIDNNFGKKKIQNLGISL